MKVSYREVLGSITLIVACGKHEPALERIDPKLGSATATTDKAGGGHLVLPGWEDLVARGQEATGRRSPDMLGLRTRAAAHSSRLAEVAGRHLCQRRA